MRPHGKAAELERRRCQAVERLRDGQTPVEVARELGVDRRSVRRWNAAFRSRGYQGLRAKPVAGRPWKLDARSRKALERELLKGAGAAGFTTDLWTCRRVAELIHQRFRVKYHTAHVGRLLHALGWSPQRPARRARERDEARIQAWIKETWPRIKKGLRG